METINNKLTTQPLIEQSMQVRQSQTLKTSEDGTVCVYQDAKADNDDILLAVRFLNGMFQPRTDQGFMAMLSNQIIETGMTKRQLSDAVKFLARTNKYNTWNISDIVSYTARIKTYSANDVYRMTGQVPSPLYPLVDLGGQQVTVCLSDAINYRLAIVRDYSEYK